MLNFCRSVYMKILCEFIVNSTQLQYIVFCIVNFNTLLWQVIGTVQTLLSTRKVNTTKSSSEKPSKEDKRTHSDVSMDSSIDLAVIQNDLEAIKGKLEKVMKKNDLDQLSQSLVKKSDKLMDNLKKELD